MAQMNIAQVEKFEILPSNQPANNIYSFRNGNPVITFNIGSQSKLLKASTLRINGELEVLTNAGAIANNNNLKGAGAVGIVTNHRVGASSIIQNVNISSNDTGQTLESVRQYGRLVASILPSTHSLDDFVSNYSTTELNAGLVGLSSNLNNNRVSFSIRLMAGMLNGGQAIPMGVNGVRGLQISIELASDQQVLSGAQAALAGGAFYQVRNLSLTGDMLVPDANGLQQLAVPGNGSFSYNSYNNLYSVIDSSDSTQTYNLANSNVLNVFHNFLPVSHANSYGQDSFSTNLPQLTNAAGTVYNGGNIQLNKVAFSRGGMKLALDYDLNVQTQSQQGRPLTAVNINALDAIMPYSSISHLSNQPSNEGFGGSDEVVYESNGTQQTFTQANPTASGRNFAIGVALDNISGVGIDFRGQSYATRIQSNLDGKSPNAVYTYVLSKNTLVYSPQGIQVQS
tara:strand:- start:50 stop:1411 length:1362 start_codon:yes stop_codon:yes gene_type:complete